MKNENIEESVKELLEDLNEYYKEDNWLIVKKFLVLHLNPMIRKNFTTRHHKTKKHSLNLYEKNIIKYYYENYNIKLRLYDEDRHKEEITSNKK